MTANHVFTFTVDAAPAVTATTPVNAATGQVSTTNLTITFSEPVDVIGNWFQIVCGTSGTRTVADTVVTGGPTTFTIDPNADFAAGESCTTTVFAAQVTDQDATDPPTRWRPTTSSASRSTPRRRSSRPTRRPRARACRSPPT